AANEKYARQVADHLDLFDSVLASDDETNLSGRRKLDALEHHLNGSAFDYAADHGADGVIWRAAREAILVNTTAKLAARTRSDATVGATFARAPAGWRVWAEAMRVHQWLKNGLIFV